MNWNPIWIREMKTRARVVRIPILLMFYNTVAALIAVFMLLVSVDIFNNGKYIYYSGMTSLFAGIGILQCGVGFFITLILSSGEVSGEWEKDTIDLMFASPVSAGVIIRGKLMAAITTGFVFAISGFPVMMIGTIYGGIGMREILHLGLVFFVLSLFAGSIGIFCSTIVKKSSISVVFSFILSAVFILGPFIVTGVIDKLIYNRMYGMLETLPTLGGWVLLHLMNPGMLLIDFYDKVLGSRNLMDIFFYNYGIESETVLSYFLETKFILCSMIVQCVISFSLVFTAVKRLETDRRKQHRKKKRKKGCREDIKE